MRFVRVVRWPSLTIDEALVALYEPYYDARGTYEVLYPFAAMGYAMGRPLCHHGASAVLVGLRGTPRRREFKVHYHAWEWRENVCAPPAED